MAATWTSFSVLWILAAAGCAGNLSEDREPVRAPRESLVPSASLPQRSREVTEIGSASEEVIRLPRNRLAGVWPREPLHRISLDLQRTPIRRVLATLSSESRLNIVVSDEVQGAVTATLRDIPWTEVLSVACQQLDLVAWRDGNVVRVMRREEWHREVER